MIDKLLIKHCKLKPFELERLTITETAFLINSLDREEDKEKDLNNKVFNDIAEKKFSALPPTEQLELALLIWQE